VLPASQDCSARHGSSSIVGVASVWDAAISVGWGGMALLCVYGLANFCLLGAAWLVLDPPYAWRKIATYIWGRAARDSAGEILPISQLVGLVVGARAVMLRGISQARRICLHDRGHDLGDERAGRFHLCWPRDSRNRSARCRVADSAGENDVDRNLHRHPAGRRIPGSATPRFLRTDRARGFSHDAGVGRGCRRGVDRVRRRYTMLGAG
jgi:hypothetical protein